MKKIIDELKADRLSLLIVATGAAVTLFALAMALWR